MAAAGAAAAGAAVKQEDGGNAVEAGNAHDEAAPSGAHSAAANAADSVDLLMRVIRSDAPTELTMQRAVGLIWAAQKHNATSILSLLPSYLQVMLDTAPLQQVCAIRTVA
jgi:hypothetical protein